MSSGSSIWPSRAWNDGAGRLRRRREGARVRTIDTVLFDLDDTLHDDTAAYQAAARLVAVDVARTHPIDPAALVRAYVDEATRFWKMLAAEHLAVGITDTRSQMWLDALRAVGLDDAALAERCANDYTRYRAEVLVLSPGSLACVTALRERGCKLGIVTNGFAATHHDKIARLGLTPHFDALFIADEMQMVKPDPAVFRHACERLGSRPERTAMVGDRFDRDVVGAAEVGLYTILIDVHGIPIPAGAQPPDAVAPTIADVLALLEPMLPRAEAVLPPA
jgi:putative hydrolase of the HAD superfamily